MTLPLSILDLAPVAEGVPAAAALRRTVELARLAEASGYTRLWYAEHHGMPTIASSSPEVLVANAAAHTTRLRLGPGGVMLPNHVPLRVAETYRTLEALWPGRIDLGIGRAGGADGRTLRALRAFDGEQFPHQLAELLAFDEGFPADHPFAGVRVVPDGVALPPIWLLGSSGASAEFAGHNGLGYAFAGHFSQQPAAPAFDAYRRAFRPSDRFPEPHAVLCLAAVCAPTAEEAAWRAGSMELAWVRLQRGELRAIPTPEEAASYPYTDAERAVVEGRRRLDVVGDPDAVRRAVEARAGAAGADEVMLSTGVHDHGARLASFRLVAEAFGLAGEPATRERAPAP